MPQNYNPTIFLPAQSQLFLGGFSFVADSFDRPSIGRYNRNVHLDSVPLMVPFMSVIQWRSLEQICFRNSNGRSNGEGIAYIFHQFERRIECLYFLLFYGSKQCWQLLAEVCELRSTNILQRVNTLLTSRYLAYIIHPLALY